MKRQPEGPPPGFKPKHRAPGRSLYPRIRTRGGAWAAAALSVSMVAGMGGFSWWTIQDMAPPSAVWEPERTDPNDLHGAGKKPSLSQHQQLMRAAVRLVRYPKNGVPHPDGQYCSGTKVAQGSKTYILSAAHCFKGDVGDVLPAGLPQAMNIDKELDYSHAIVDPNVPNVRRVQVPLGKVARVAVSRSGDTDLALLTVKDTSPAFDNKPAIPLSLIAYGDRPPLLPGQEVAMYTATDASSDEPIITSGKYLGRTSDLPTNGWSKRLDLVGVRPDRFSKDPCTPGASGATGWFAEGSVGGPLAIANNTYYPLVEPTPTTVQDPRDAAATRDFIEHKLKVDASGFPTICGFSVIPSQGVVTHLVRALEDPLYRYPA